MNKVKNKAHKPRDRQSSLLDITKYLSPAPMKSLYEPYMEDNKRNRMDDDSSDSSPQLKPVTEKEKNDKKNELLLSGIPRNSGSAAGSK